VEPTRGLSHLEASGASGAGQRGRLHRRLGRHGATRPGRSGDTKVPAGRSAGLRPVRASAGISLVQRASRPTGAAMATAAPPARNQTGRRTPISVRTRSSRTWPLSPSSSAAIRRRPARARHRPAHPHRHLQPVRGRQVLLHHDGCVRRSRRPASIRSLIVTRPSWPPRSGN
jgi:hypothetical protein